MLYFLNFYYVINIPHFPLNVKKKRKTGTQKNLRPVKFLFRTVNRHHRRNQTGNPRQTESV